MAMQGHRPTAGASLRKSRNWASRWTIQRLPYGDLPPLRIAHAAERKRGGYRLEGCFGDGDADHGGEGGLRRRTLGDDMVTTRVTFLKSHIVPQSIVSH